MAFNFPPKQDVLVSGTNIKTINSNSILGSGDLTISGANVNLSNLSAPTAINVQLRSPNGSASSPSYSFTNNTNTGLYADATSLYIASGGQQMFQMTSGDIYVSKNLRFDGQIFGMSGKSVGIGNWTFGGSGQFIPSVDATAYSQRYNSIGRSGDSQNLQRPYRIDVAREITVGKKFGSSSFAMYGATLAATQNDDVTTTFTTTANASTTIVSNTGDGPQILIDIGSYIQLNGLSTTARVTNFTFSYPNVTLTVDTALGDGTSRAIIVKQPIVSFRKSDGTEVMLIDNSGNVSLDSAVTINDSGADQDTRIEGDTDQNLVFVDASTDRVGIGLNNPSVKFEVSGDSQLNGVLVVNESGADKDMRVEGDTDTNLLFTDASADKVGIGTSTPAEKLEVNGNIKGGTISFNADVNRTGTVTNLGFLTNTKTHDFGSLSHGAEEETTITVTGAAVGDACFVGAPSTVELGLSWDAYVSAADTVTLRIYNYQNSGTIDPASATWRVTVLKS